MHPIENGLNEDNKLEQIVDNLTKPLVPLLKNFLSTKGDFYFEIYDKKHFAFSPEDRTISIPKFWIEEYLNRTNQNGPYMNMFSEEYFYFVIFHETSHYRDMMMELKLSGKESMYKTLKRVSEEKILIGEEEYIPIGEPVHILYNCIDDTIVNSEVEKFYIGVEKEKQKKIYKEIQFAELIEKEGGEFIINEEGKKVYVGEGQGTHNIILDGEIDYKDLPMHYQFSYALLRGKMVEEQDVLLDKKVQNIFFKNDFDKGFTINEEVKFDRNTIKQSLENLISEMKDYLEKVKKSDDEVILKRVEKIENSYSEHISILENKLEHFGEIDDIILKIIQQSGTKKVNKKSASLIDLLNFFSYSYGSGKEHRLHILPQLRYEAVESIFEPIQKGLILMDLLIQDIKDGEGKDGNGEGKDGNGEGEAGNGSGSGRSHTLHESPSFEEKLKELEEAIKEQEKKETEASDARKQQEKSKQKIQEILEKNLQNKGIQNPKLALEIYNDIILKNIELINNLVSFLKNQILSIEKGFDLEEFHTKKGTLDYNTFFKKISQDPSGSNISGANIYTKKEVIEKLKETFKELDFYMLLDISGSMERFKGKGGMLTIISAVLFNVMKQIEKVIQAETGDYDYKIPVNFLLYGDGEVYSTLGRELEDQEIPLDMIDKSIRLSGGTNDATGWKRIADFFAENHMQDEEYKHSITEGKKAPFIIQIADTDVSENGVGYLKKVFEDNVGEVGKKIPVKRIVLGEVIEQEISEENLERLGEIGNWDIKEVDGKIIRQQVGIKSKKEIEEQLKNIFENFLLELIKK